VVALCVGHHQLLFFVVGIVVGIIVSVHVGCCHGGEASWMMVMVVEGEMGYVVVDAKLSIGVGCGSFRKVNVRTRYIK
jgi:hypothetical protein